MGLGDKLLTFGNSRRGKIISWIIIVVMTIVFFGGILLMNIGTINLDVTNLELSAPNISYGSLYNSEDLPITGYHLTTSALETAVTVTTTPMGHSEPVVFSTNAPEIEIKNPRVKAGGSVVIALKKQANGFYFFSSSDPKQDIDRIRINVTCKDVLKVIYVRVVLSEDIVGVTASLESNRNGNQNDWGQIEQLHMPDITNEDTPLSNLVQYRFRFTFSILGELIYDTANGNIEKYPDDQITNRISIKGTENYFEWVQLDTRVNTQPFYEQENPGPNKYFLRIEKTENPDEFRIPFKICCNYNGEDYFTDTLFIVNIVEWSRT